MTAATRTVRIGSSHGLHARPAKIFAQAAKDAGIPVTIGLTSIEASLNDTNKLWHAKSEKFA